MARPPLLFALLHGAAALVAEPRHDHRRPALSLQDRYDLLQDRYRQQEQREAALRKRLALLQQEPDEAVPAVELPQQAQPEAQPEALVSDPHSAPGSSFAGSAGGLSTYKLRLCNAFAWPHPLEMSRVQEPQLVEYPLPYKACHDYLLPLQEGDELQFNAGGQRVGSFAVRSLPQEPGSLLLIVPHRRDRESGAVAFESHIFKTNTDAQVAVIDVYRGPEKSAVMMGDGGRREELPFDSVVALAPGSYPFALQGMDQLSSKRRAASKTSNLVAKQEENYCILRVGMGDDTFPEELVMFPWSAASRMATWPAMLLAALASCLFASA